MDIFDLPAPTLTMIGVLAAYLMIDDLNANQQNALGNFFMLIGQVLETNAAFLQNQQGAALSERITNLEREIELIKNNFV